MTHANAPLTPRASPPGRADRCRGLDDPAGRRTVPGLAGDGVEVGGRYRAGRADDGLLLAAAAFADGGARDAAGAAHREAAVLPPVGTAPDRLPPGVPRSTVGRVLAPLPDAAAGPPRPGHRAAGPHGRAGPLRSTPRPATWSMSTSRSSAGSPTVAAGEPSDGLGQHRSRNRNRPSNARRAASRGYVFCTTPSTTTPGWPTPRSSATNARRPPPRSGAVPDAFFADAGITVKAVMTDNGSCYRSRASPRPSGRDQAPTHPPLPAPDQRQSRTLQPHPGHRMGLRRRSTSPTKPAQPPTRTGSTPTITTDPTPASAATVPAARVHNLTGNYS